jgi:hypothetical protein
MRTSRRITAVSLIVIALAAYGFFYSSRCSVSPAVDLNMLAGSITMQLVGIALATWGIAQAPIPTSRGTIRWFFWAGLAVFLSTVFMARKAIEFSDSFGHPNGYQSVGLLCKAG